MLLVLSCISVTAAKQHNHQDFGFLGPWFNLFVLGSPIREPNLIDLVYWTRNINLTCVLNELPMRGGFDHRGL